MPKRTEVVCDWCGERFTKKSWEVYPHNFCCIEHFRRWNSGRMSQYNADENEMNQPIGWTDERKERQREERLGSDIKGYRKYHQKHEHRVVASETLGRPLGPDEVVHHVDGDKSNNSPDNLRVMSRSDHAKLHAQMAREARGGDAHVSI